MYKWTILKGHRTPKHLRSISRDSYGLMNVMSPRKTESLCVSGDDYAIGFQHGTGARDGCRRIFHHIFETIGNSIKLPFEGGEIGFVDLLERLWSVQKAHTPENHLARLKGLAD